MLRTAFAACSTFDRQGRPVIYYLGDGTASDNLCSLSFNASAAAFAMPISPVYCRRSKFEFGKPSLFPGAASCARINNLVPNRN
jgi:hypothetical protein